MTKNYAASARSSIVLMILAMLEPGPPIAPAMPAEGAAIQFTIEEIKGKLEAAGAEVELK